jgi:PEP-CTERM motif-containing protein
MRNPCLLTRRPARRTGLLLGGALGALLGAGHPADALVITPTFASNITSDPNAAAIEGVINTAISTYEADFNDPITVAITFQEGGGLGGSSTFFANVSYSAYLSALTADATTSNDATALAHLPTGPNNPVNGSSTINVKTANLRAVGINVNPPAGQPDGTITLNTSLTFPGSPGSSTTYSLLSVTEHEIDEVLGLGSSLPTVPFGTIFPEDLFRYDAAGNRSFTTNPTAKAFFSINGTTDLAQFDNQNDGGDFGDWQSNPLPPGVSPKVQDAFATPGATPSLGVELTALDVIGYDFAAVPEPGTLALLGSSLFGFAALRRRRQ